MIRKLLLLSVLLLVACDNLTLSPEQQAWSEFKQQFMTVDGRILDNGNNDISHSESQGYGLLFAVYFDDDEAFETIWKWTQQQLQVRNDYLFSWKYVTGQGVTDSNNASDGDVLISWALLQAARQWHNAHYQQQSENIFRDIRNKLIQEWQGHKILLPAEKGFILNSNTTTINLSYWVFPAFINFMKVDLQPVWQELIDSGLYFTRVAKYGKWNLPVDWLQLNSKIELSDNKPPLFGYEAIRIPLYLQWARLLDPKESQYFTKFYNACLHQLGYLSPTANLINNKLANYPAPIGFISVYQLISGSKITFSDNKAGDYYSQSLRLLAYIAQQQSSE